MANAIVQQIAMEMQELQKQLSQFKSSVEYLNNAKSNVSTAVEAVSIAENSFNDRIKEVKETYQSFIQLSDAVWAIVQKIETINFPERLDSIQATVKETIASLDQTKEATVREVQKAANAIIEADFDGKFSKLHSDIDTSVNSNRELAEGIKKMQLIEKIDDFEKVISRRFEDGYKELESNTKRIADSTSRAILDLNLPIRIDKLDANIAGISAGVQNLQGRLDLVESNLKERLWEVAEKQTHVILTLKDQLLTALQNQNLEVKKIQKRQLSWSVITLVAIVVSFLIVFFLK